MRVKRWTAMLSGLVALAALAVPPRLAQADAPRCAYAGKPVGGALKKKIAVFQADGKWLKDADAAALAAGAKVLDCNESLGLVKVEIEGKAQWVDRLALDIRNPRGPDCVARAASRPADVTEPVTSGVSENCVQGDGK